MREIKFRAWNKDTKTMIDLQKITPLALNDVGQSGLFIPFEKEIPIMQYTGLKDKHGKEIFEGDILRYEVLNKTYVVEWKNDTHEWKLNNRNQRDKLEIIGNIYEEQKNDHETITE